MPVTPEKALSFLKLMLLTTPTFPLPANPTRAQIIRMNFMRVFYMLNASTMAVALSYATYIFRDDIVALFKSFGLALGCVHILLINIVFTVHHKRLQSLVLEMEKYFKTATDWRRDILQQYTDKCATFYATVILMFYSTAITVIAGPAVVPNQTYPTDAQYPFSIESMPLKILSYVLQSIYIAQAVGHVSVSGFMAYLLWFVTARFTILAERLRRVKTFSDVYSCVEEHQYLIRYCEDVTFFATYVFFTAILACFILLIIGFIVLILPVPIDVKIQFGGLCATMGLDIFIVAWPADKLMSTSDEVAFGIYDSNWYEMSVDMRKTITILIMRCLKPITITVPCFIPEANLNYFGSFISTCFSYFTTLRVMIVDE